MSIVEKFIEDTCACSSRDDIFQILQNTLQDIGYDRVVYSFLTDHPRLGKPAGHGIQKNYPDDWMAHYVSKGYFNIDPVPKQAFSSPFPFTWDGLIEQSSLNDDELLVMNEAREARLLDGVGVPIYGVGGEIAGLGIASSTGGIYPDKRLLCIIRALANQFHYAYSIQPYEEAMQSPETILTAKEKEVLHWIAEGKSQEEIGDILHISANTVKYHTKNIFQKLDVSEKTLAVVKSIRLNIINPSTLRVI
jgi:DNA-binding CsgD family transcriptional regulator